MSLLKTLQTDLPAPPLLGIESKDSKSTYPRDLKLRISPNLQTHHSSPGIRDMFVYVFDTYLSAHILGSSVSYTDDINDLV